MLGNSTKSKNHFAAYIQNMTPLSTQTFGGTLDVLGIPEVLQLVSSSRKTGVLRFAPSHPELELKLALRDGRVVGVTGRSVPKITDVLLRFGVPPQTVGQLGAALHQSKNPQVLQTLGQDILEKTPRWRLEFGLLPLWQLRVGEFEFATTEAPASLETGLNLEPAMLEVARRVDELSRLVAVPLEAVYNIAERVGDFSSALKTLMPPDWNLLNTIDGESDVLSVGTQALLPYDELTKRLLHLEQVGLIELKNAQRGVQRKYTRLQPGDLAPAFTLPALDGSSFSLGSLRGKKTLLAFFRHAGCPFCNLRVHQLIEAYPRLQRFGIEVVGVFGSSLEGLRARVGQQRPPFALLADPDDAIHTLYGTNRSVLGLLASFSPSGLGNYLEGLRLGIQHGSTDGEATRMPADFLIAPDLKIEQALYGGNAGEHITIKALEQWGMVGAR
jgi:peroxiredoxin